MSFDSAHAAQGAAAVATSPAATSPTSPEDRAARPATSAAAARYLGADDALDDDCDEYCAWCGRGGEMQGFEGRPFCGEDCANSWWYEWGHDD